MSSISLGTGPLLDVDEFMKTRLLVQGSSGSGKSHLLKLILEGSAALVQQIVIDVEPEFGYLQTLFGHSVVDAAKCYPHLGDLGRQVRERGVSAVLDLSGLDPDDQVGATALFLDGVFDVEPKYWTPAIVVVDEAHLFAGADMPGDKAQRAAATKAMSNLMARGRKRGLNGVLATQRVAKISKNVVAEASNFLIGRTYLDIDMGRAANLLGLPKSDAGQFRLLDRGQFVAFGPALTLEPAVLTARGRTPVAAPERPRLAPLVLPAVRALAPPACCVPSAPTSELPEPLSSLLLWLRATSAEGTAWPGYLAVARAVPGVTNSLHAKLLVESLVRQGWVALTDGVHGVTLTLPRG